MLFSVIGTGNGMVKVAQGCVDPVTSTLHIIKGMFTYKGCNVGVGSWYLTALSTIFQLYHFFYFFLFVSSIVSNLHSYKSPYITT